jgi:hypothetical protein
VPIGLAAALVALFAVVYCLKYYLPAFNTKHTVLEGIAHPPSPLAPSPAPARRVTLIVVDGLNFDLARSLPELAPLRRAGVFRPLTPKFPSYTSPALASFVLGLDPRESGVRLNGSARGVEGVDWVAREAGLSHVPVRVFLREWPPFEPLMGAPEGSPIHHGRLAYVADLAERRVLPPPPPLDGTTPARALDFVYIGEVDETAHVHGTHGPEFEEAMHRSGAMVDRWIQSIDLEQDAVIVASDHGHIYKGGHGGDEPEVLRAFAIVAGAFVRKGVELDARSPRDIAPTLTTLAGLRAPTSGLALPMMDALALDDEQAAFVLAPTFDQAAHLVCRVHPQPRCGEIDALVARLRSPNIANDPTAWESAVALFNELEATRATALTARGESNAASRLEASCVAIAALAIAAFLALGRTTRGKSGRVFEGVRPAVLALTVLHAAIWFVWLRVGLGYGMSFSEMKPGIPFILDALPVGAVATLVTLVAARYLDPGPRGRWFLLAGHAAPYAALAAFVGGDPAVVASPKVANAPFLAGPAMISIAVVAALVGFIAPQKTEPSPRISP